MACSSRVATPRDTGSPTPAAGPAPGPGTTGTPEATPASEGTGGLPQSRAVPLRPDQAPLVHVNDVLEGDSLLGRRGRGAGRGTAAGARPAGGGSGAGGGGRPGGRPAGRAPPPGARGKPTET